MSVALGWRPDVLGDGFEAATIELPRDDEGAVTATVVRGPAPHPEERGAVLYLHGYNDYFFQTDLAKWYAERGWAFYALDLRKHGRSLLAHQTPNFCRSLEDFDPDLDAAAAIIAGEHPGPLLLLGHSTGGLIAPLWVARRPALGLAGMVLNSPFLDFKQPPAETAVLAPLIRAVARHHPTAVFPGGVRDRYGDSIHASRSGEWEYDLRWKPLQSFPVRYGWLAAVSAGHARVRAGLGLEMPVLVMSSTRSVAGRAPVPDLMRGDAILNATRIARRA
ncbi:MAG: alpha/beta hydrolase, partial [Acidimicrobiaceae bacterium]|nr:alpha/beta hydrolase [Acidimicrobiaceae bacterium]